MSRSSNTADPGIGLSKPHRKLLSSLGHHVARLAAACDHLVARDSSLPGLAPWLRANHIRQGNAIAGSGIFACPLTLDGSRLGLHPLLATTAQCAASLPTLTAAVPDSAAPLATPDALNDPLWPALLRLRPLRDFWERELRRATLDLFLDLLPDSWLLDPAPLPPGSVIPRLELASWNQLNPAERRFIPATAAGIAAALSAYPDTPGTLTALPELSPDAIPILSFYLKSDTRIDWLGVVGRPPAANPPQ